MAKIMISLPDKFLREVDRTAKAQGRSRSELMQGHQFFSFRITQWPQQYAIHNTEDGRVGGDSDRDRQQGNRSKHGIVAQRSQPVTDIPQEVFHKRPCPHIETLLFNQAYVPKLS